MDDSSKGAQDMTNMFQREPEQHDQEQVTKQTPTTSTGFVGQPSPPTNKNKNNLLAITYWLSIFP